MMTLKEADPRTYQVELWSWSMQGSLLLGFASNLLRKGAPSKKKRKKKRAPEKEKKTGILETASPRFFMRK